ncbi:hypothetical protein [Kitasatospora cineracea]
MTHDTPPAREPGRPLLHIAADHSALTLRSYPPTTPVPIGPNPAAADSES